MSRYFSATTGGFYHPDINPEIPADAVVVSDAAFDALFAAQAEGKLITADETGHPVAIDPPAPDSAERMRQLRSKRDKRLRESDFAVLPDAPFDEPQRDAWRDYRQALRDLPETFAADPAAAIWPEAPAAN